MSDPIPTFPEYQYGYMESCDAPEPPICCIYDDKNDAAEEALKESASGPYVAVYKLLRIEKVTKAGYKFKEV